MDKRKLLLIGVPATLGVLQVGLIAAQLSGAIHAPWWLVTAPLWVPVAAVAVLAIALLALLGHDASSGGNQFR